MKVVKLSHPNYEYDVHSLVKAFYAEDQVTVITPETKPEKLAELEPQVSLEIELAETGAKIRVGEEIFLWEAASEAIADGYKNGLKRFLYRTLSKMTGQKLPWGNLTGIRPTKIAYGMLDEGRSDAEILDFMEQSHYVSEEKALLGIDIAKRERDLLKEIHYEGGYSLYIGIPFCPTTCLYCSFTSYPIAAFRRQVDAYVDAVIKEMDYVAENFQDKVLDTVYIGGGTPTTLEPEQLDRLITALKSKFDFSTVKEFTVEAGRADSITREKLEVLHRHQVSRISVNPQTVKQETLDIIGRKASVEQVLTAYRLAREVGFDNINMDIIAGLPGETPEDMEDTLRQIALLGPDNLTVHSLAIKRAARMGQEEREGKRLTIIQDEIGTMVEMAGNKARQMGLFPYYLYRQKNIAGNFENVGYAKVDKAGIYNILIMEEKQSIIAAGAGASTKIVLKEPVINPESKKKKKTSLIRQENVKAIDAYISRVDEMIERKGEWLWR